MAQYCVTDWGDSVLTQAYQFKNRFFFMRHGQSLANRNGIIVSAPDIGVNDYPLTGQGVGDVAERAFRSRLDSNVNIVSSDFLRTRQTAEIIAEIIDAKAVRLTPALRERFFGDFDGLTADHYEQVWQLDEQGVVKYQVETIASVLERVLRCVWECEQSTENETFLLVSHGDCLQIVLSWLQGLSPRFHRQIPAIKPSSIRMLNNQQSLQNILNQLNLETHEAA